MVGIETPEKEKGTLDLGGVEVKRAQSLEVSRAERYSTQLRPTPRTLEPRMTFRRLPHVRLALASLLVPLAGALAACGDPLGARANLSVGTDTLVVYALSDPDPSRRDYPTALMTAATTSIVGGTVFVAPRVLSASGSGDFDVAFDLDGTGKVVVIPQRRVVPGASGRAVGLLKSDQSFDALTEAPKRGYQFDTTAVAIGIGETLVLQTQTGACLNDSRGASPYLFSKLVVDSVPAATRAIHFRLTVDPNCGFRSFKAGVPGN
jgi:hypothetical protein